MDDFWASHKDKLDGGVDKQTHDQRDLATQATISVVLGLSAFIAFCVSRNVMADKYSYANPRVS